jgi:hypothetical protein
MVLIAKKCKLQGVFKNILEFLTHPSLALLWGFTNPNFLKSNFNLASSS